MIYYRAGLHRVAIMALAICAALLLVTGTARADDAARAVTVQGEAERRVAPDMATLRVDVQTEGLEPATARREADELTAAALAILQQYAIADADIDSTGLSINPQYRWLKNEQRQQLTGYRVSRTISVRVLELDNLGPLLVALSDGGVSRVQPPRLSVADDESIQRELMAAATLNARERATAIAAALGEEIGEVLTVNTTGETRHVAVPMARMAMAAESADMTAGADSYTAGHITFSASVIASFALE